MKMKKRLFALALSVVTCLSLAACGGGSKAPAASSTSADAAASAATSTPASGTTLKVGATPAPHAEILEQVKPILAKEGITLDIVEYNDYNTPNDAVEDGSLNAIKYNKDNGTHLASVAEVHYEPFGLYAGKTASIADLPDGAQIAVPNDATNEARALLLLQQEGLIKLADGVGINATKLDIKENKKNLEILELEAAQIPTRLKDVDLAVINGNYAIDAGLKVADALAVESKDGDAATAYVNVVAVKEGNEKNEAIQALVKALKSDTIRDYINNTYGGAVVPVF